MQLKSISVTYGRKLNLGDFNSVHSEITLWADLETGDDEAAATEALRQMARHQVVLELARIQPALEAKVQNIFAGLPVSVQKSITNGEEGYANQTSHAADSGFSAHRQIA
jgi:hypothetical protein